jgi:hypothetical protein
MRLKPTPRGWLFLFSAACVVAVVWLTLCAVCRGESVKLGWNPNPESDIAGYILFYGTGTLDTQIATGNVTSYVVTDLQPATTYTFGLKAVNTSGLESGMSETITHTTVAAPVPLDMSGSTAVASSQEIVRENTAASNAIDNQPQTFFHTQWEALPPHYLWVTLPKNALASGLYYEPRQDGSLNGTIVDYEIESSLDGVTWEPWLTGEWANDLSGKLALLPLREVRHFRIWTTGKWMSASEVRLAGTYVADAPPATVAVSLKQSSDLSDWSEVFQQTFPAGRRFFRLAVDGKEITYEIKPITP